MWRPDAKFQPLIFLQKDKNRVGSQYQKHELSIQDDVTEKNYTTFCRTNTSSSQILNARTNIPQSTTIPHQNLVPIPSRRSSSRIKTIKKSGGDRPDNSLMRRRTNAGRSLRIKAKLMRKYSKNFTSNETWGTSSPYTKNFAPTCRGQISRLYQARGGRRSLKDDVIMRNGFVDGWVSCNCCCCLSVSQWDPSSAATCLIKAWNYTVFNSHAPKRLSSMMFELEIW